MPTCRQRRSDVRALEQNALILRSPLIANGDRMNRLVASLQHKRLSVLAARQKRVLWVQPLRSPDVQKLTRWVPWDSLPVTQEVWTRAVTLDEVLFDVDARPWSRVAEVTGMLHAALDELGVPYEAALTGGKGTHTHVWLDPASIQGPRWLLDTADALGVDFWNTTRMTIAEALLDAAGFPPGDEHRWAAPIGQGPFDRLKVKWAAGRRGSMVRMLGTMGGAGFRKTLLPEGYDLARQPTPPVPLRWSFDIRPWKVPAALSDRIMTNLEVEVGKARARADAPPEPQMHPIAALKTLRRVPCVARTLTEAVPKGSRHYAFLNLVATCFRLGVPRAAAAEALQRALKRTGLPPNDPAVDIIAEVYDGRYDVSRLACPSPHTTAWCVPNACALSRGFDFCSKGH